MSDIRCKIFGHKWVPVFIGGKNFDFIGTFCKRCHFGKEDLTDYVFLINHDYGTYSQKYWKGVN